MVWYTPTDTTYGRPDAGVWLEAVCWTTRVSVGWDFGKDLAGTRGNDDKTLAALWEALLMVREDLANNLNKMPHPFLKMTYFPSERVAIGSKHIDQRVEPPNKLKMINPERLL